MAKIIYSPAALGDLERFVEYLLEHSPGSIEDAIAKIFAAVAVLADHPEIGRRTDAGRRELVISRGATGYVALYAYDPVRDLVRVLRLRHQREAGYRS